MKGTFAAFLLTSLVAALTPPTGKSAIAQQLSAQSAPNAVSMSVMKELKTQQREQDRKEGVFALDRYVAQGATKCSNGKAGEYMCNNIDLKGFLRHQDMGSSQREGNDLWGMHSSS